MTNTHFAFLKEMGISEWISRDAVEASQVVSEGSSAKPAHQESKVLSRNTHGVWWFFGNEPQGDVKILFQNLIRVLGLAKNEWSWINPSDKLNQLSSPDVPVVAVAFGGAVAQKITGERDSLSQLRETVLALNTGSDEEIPVIASFELNQALAKPAEKALLWQDLLLAKSVLQNI